MILKETQTQWGNLYKRRYFLNGKRISESYANIILRDHMYEDLDFGKDSSGNWYKTWGIGPKADMPSLYDHPDMI